LVLRLYGCVVTRDDAEHLVAALIASERAASLEAASAVRWGTEWNLAVGELEPDLRDALLDALAEPPPGLVQLRAALEQSAASERGWRRLSQRLYNPRSHHCECLSDCWCKRTTWGRMLRWYIPGRYHSSISACVASESEPG
jgi:hypothetical protein